MKVSSIERLSQIKQKSPLATAYFSYDGDNLYLISKSTMTWIIKLDISEKTKDDDDMIGTIDLNPDSIKKITEIFETGEVSITFKQNQIIFEQDYKKLNMDIREKNSNAKLAEIAGGDFKYIGKLNEEILAQTKIKDSAKTKDKASSLILPCVQLHKNRTMRINMAHISINRILNDWKYEIDKDIIKIDTEILGLFDTTSEIFVNSKYILIRKEGTEVYINLNLNKESETQTTISDTDMNNKINQVLGILENAPHSVELNRDETVKSISLFNRIYKEEGAVSLKFKAIQDGFKINAKDIDSSLEVSLNSSHNIEEGSVFCVSGALLENIKYFPNQNMKAKLNIANGQLIFYDGNYIESSSSAYLVLLQKEKA